MVAPSHLTLGIVGVYLLLILGIGQYTSRFTDNSREDYLMASRSFGTVVLFFALFATNLTAVVIFGGPGLAYVAGIGAFGYFVGASFLLPVAIMTLGYRFWIIGKEWGHITPAQIINHRWEAKYLGLVLTAIYTVWMIPYIFVSVQGGAIALSAFTNGLIPYWGGTLLILGVVTLYVYQGGMRGTAWTNTFQGAVLMLFILTLFIWISLKLGGFVEATSAVAKIKNEVFLNRAGIPLLQPRNYFSLTLLGTLGLIMFPHLIIRFMTARSIKNLKQTAVLYPIAMVLTWGPAVFIGFWGIAQIPNLQNPNFILPEMVGELLPTWMFGFALAGVLAAVMSSLDGQVLTLSTFFSEDVLNEFYDVDEDREMWFTRAFLVFIYLAALVGALFFRDRIIDTAVLFLAGFGLTFFPIVVGLYWRRSTKESVYVGILTGFVGLWLFVLGVLPESLTFGFHPFVVVFVIQILLTVLTALVTEPPSDERIEAYEDAFQGGW
jgi:SSS family solute:Na+ symporter